jgi:8-oxo-dGTP pyrophosphatase MutT (NUDIX family)
MATVKCAGVVPITPDGRIGIIKASRAIEGGQREWVLPKGHIEEGETDSSAALREAAEESGVAGVLFISRPVVTTWTQDHEERECTFFPLLVTRTFAPAEDRGLSWVSYKEALSLLDFVEQREVMKAAWRAVRG